MRAWSGSVQSRILLDSLGFGVTAGALAWGVWPGVLVAALSSALLAWLALRDRRHGVRLHPRRRPFRFGSTFAALLPVCWGLVFGSQWLRSNPALQPWGPLVFGTLMGGSMWLVGRFVFQSRFEPTSRGNRDRVASR